jgi:hypothetical protein
MPGASGVPGIFAKTPGIASVYHAPKLGNSSEDYEDAYGFDCEGLCFCVADGATESIFAKKLADALVDTFISIGVQRKGNLKRDMAKIIRKAQARWRRSLLGMELPWYAEEKAKDGAHAAFAGIRISPGRQSESQRESEFQRGSEFQRESDDAGRIRRAQSASAQSAATQSAAASSASAQSATTQSAAASSASAQSAATQSAAASSASAQSAATQSAAASSASTPTAVAPSLAALKWEAVAVGDSCVFVVAGDRLAGSFPIQRAADFGNTPDLISSIGPVRMGDISYVGGRLTGSEKIYLASDAVSQWFLKLCEGGQKPWKILDALQSDEDFDQLIAGLRSRGEMKNDDSTIISVGLRGRYVS